MSLLPGREENKADFVTGVFTIAPSVRATHNDEIMFHGMSVRDMSLIILLSQHYKLYCSAVSEFWSLGQKKEPVFIHINMRNCKNCSM